MLARLTATTVCVLMLAGTAQAQKRGTAQAQQRDYEQVNRYTVKFFCDDLPDHLLHKGNYRTAVSIHNPDFYTAQASIQASTIDPLKPEERPVKHPKKPIELGAHALQLMDCKGIKNALIDPAKDNTNPFKVGLLHITSARALDVTAVYSVAAKGEELSSSFSMGEVTRQRIRACDEKKPIRLGDYANWEIESREQPAPLSPRRARSGRELAPGRAWMAYKAAGNPSSEYIYRLRYCVCSGGGELTGSSLTVRSEGSSAGTLHAVAAAKSQKDDKASKIDELWDMKGQGNAFPDARETAVKSTKFSDVGDGWIEVRISSGPGSSAISFTGDLVLDDGHPGYCQPPRY